MRDEQIDLPVDRPIARVPTHPGELFREVLDDHVRLTVSEAARRMQVSRQSLHAVLRGEASVSADMALRFGRLTGGSPDLYVQMQAQRDLWLAQQRLQATLAKIEPVA
jgi:addiction module HigA family antidote